VSGATRLCGDEQWNCLQQKAGGTFGSIGGKVQISNLPYFPTSQVPVICEAPHLETEDVTMCYLAKAVARLQCEDEINRYGAIAE
jgi:hypothetical protein